MLSPIVTVSIKWLPSGVEMSKETRISVRQDDNNSQLTTTHLVSMFGYGTTTAQRHTHTHTQTRTHPPVNFCSLANEYGIVRPWCRVIRPLEVVVVDVDESSSNTFTMETPGT